MIRNGIVGLFSVACFALVLFPQASLAADPTLHVGYVDLQKALMDSTAGSAAKDSYEKEVRDAQTKLDVKKRELERLQSEFAKRRDSLSTEARMEREEKLVATERDLRRSFEDTQEQLRRKNGQMVSELLQKLAKVVDEVGKEQGYTLILEKGSQAVLYADNSIDITDEVVKRFNKMN